MKQSRNLTTGLYSNAVKTAIRSSYNAVALPRLTVDWNWNRYTTPVADNIPAALDDSFDSEAFPIESIVDPVRPTKGICKARVNESTVAEKYTVAHTPRFYIGGTDDVYKYWTSPYPTDASGAFPLHTDGITTARPHVLYPKALKTNKIVIKLENTWATPSDYDVRTKASTASGWSNQINGTNITIASDGTITLYWTGTAWSSSRPTTLQTTNVAGIMLTVRTMTSGRDRAGNITKYSRRIYSFEDLLKWGQAIDVDTDGKNSSLNVISIEAHYEVDLTDRLISVSDDFEMAESSQLYPIGTVTSNQASVVLSNEDGIFNPENTSSPYYGLMEPNAEFNLEYIYTINGAQHSVQEFKMFSSGPWSGDEGSVTVELEDSSSWLKTVKPRATMYENKTANEIIFRLLDSVGFVDYNIEKSDLVVEHVIPVFWCDGESTVWEVLDGIAHDTQTAIYFDENNILQVKTRNVAFRQSDAADWTLYGQTEGNNIADIEMDGLSYNKEYEANKVEVKYKTTKWALNSKGKPALAKVWEPETDTLVVRSAPIKQTLGLSDSFIFVGQNEVRIWPWKSKVNIEGEIIQYEGKRYLYYTGANGNIPNYVVVKDQDEVDTYNKKTPAAHRYKNGLTGALAITERGVWNTEKTVHSVDINGWSTTMEVLNNGVGIGTNDTRGFSLDRSKSLATINTPNSMKDANDTFWAFRGSSASTGYKAYGTRIQFDKDSSSTTQRGGIGFFINGGSNNGYYVELCLSNSLNASDREKRNEVMIYSKTGTNSWRVVDKGKAVQISPNKFYDLDVYIKGDDQHTISVWINGQVVARGTTDNTTKQPSGGKVCMYARGKSHIDYEYFYAIARNTKEPLDDFSFYDLKYGGVRGNLWEREYVWELKTRWKKIKKKKDKKETYKHNQYLFDEFGPYMHEIREFDVKFDNYPVQYSYLFCTNEWYAATLEYTGNPFGASFIIANTGRDNAILSGDDSLVYAGTGASVQQVTAALGRYLDIADEETITVTNDESIRARGLIETELSGDWIQSRGMAQSLANWIKNHWSSGADEIEVRIYGNPLIEIGDVVAINYDALDMSPTTHKYFVLATRNEFDQGLSTTLLLRRVRTS